MVEHGGLHRLDVLLGHDMILQHRSHRVSLPVWRCCAIIRGQSEAASPALPVESNAAGAVDAGPSSSVAVQPPPIGAVAGIVTVVVPTPELALVVVALNAKFTVSAGMLPLTE